MAMIYPFMQKLREASFPAPGNTVEINSFIPGSGTEVRQKPQLLLASVCLVFDGTLKVHVGINRVVSAPVLSGNVVTGIKVSNSE